MDQQDAMKNALEIVKAQASVRPMTEEEILSMARNLSSGIMAASGVEILPVVEDLPGVDLKKAIKESSITCLECGASFKILTKKHMAGHGLTPDEYREKWGYKKSQPLACKALTRERRKKMNEMKLWERRGKTKAA